MKKIAIIGILLIPLLFFIIIVSASLYSEKVPDPSRFTSINPLWSAILEKQDNSNITLSLIEFEWLSPNGQSSSKTTMFYLNDGINEYISDSSGFVYTQEYNSSCFDNDLYDDCVSLCPNTEPEKERCMEQCIEDYDYNCHTEVTCTQIGPDDTCGVSRSTNIYGSNYIDLNFNPASGQLSETPVPESQDIRNTTTLNNTLSSIGTFNGEELILISQSGYLSSGRIS